MSGLEVLDFFDRCRAAFDALDGDAVAALWHDASGITHDAKLPAEGAALTWWPAIEPMRANHRALCDVYREAGFAHCTFDLIEHRALGAHQATALLDWTLRRRDASPLQRFRTHYHLIRTDAGPRIVMCAAFEEDLTALREDHGRAVDSGSRGTTDPTLPPSSQP